MLPTDPELISGLPTQNRSIIISSVMGITTVILGNSLLKTSPLSSKINFIDLIEIIVILYAIVEPLHLVMGGAIGALAGLLLHKGAILTQQRVLLGQQYYLRKSHREAVNKEQEEK